MQGLYVVATHYADAVLESCPAAAAYEQDPDAWMAARITHRTPDGSTLRTALLQPADFWKPRPQTAKCLPPKASVQVASFFDATGSQELDAMLRFMQYSPWGALRVQTAGEDAAEVDADPGPADTMAVAEPSGPQSGSGAQCPPPADPTPEQSDPEHERGPEQPGHEEGAVAQAVAAARRSSRLKKNMEAEPADWVTDSGPGGADEEHLSDSDSEGLPGDEDGLTDAQLATRVTRIEVQFTLVIEEFVVRCANSDPADLWYRKS